MRLAKRIEIIQAETGYVIKVLAPNPAQIAQQRDQFKELRDKVAKMEVPEMQTFVEMMESALEVAGSQEGGMQGEIQERVLIASDGRELLDALAKIIAIWEP